MGTTRKFVYRNEYRDQKGWHTSGWEHRTKRPWLGRAPTDANAEAWRVSMNQSFQAGGVNAHVAELYGFVPHISHVRLFHQTSGKVVATAAMPMFEVV